MARPMATTIHWVGDLSDDELRQLSQVLGSELPAPAVTKIKSAYLGYVGTTAVQDGSQPTKVLRQRLKALSHAAREVAMGLGG